ncbi:MAG TPA: carboxypeptidase-like regulatory domain-containing protein, partial [Thermoanaerobaculia bacterium]|nr:carboxypeptidase-like regulatory domain-containing protein [Thermoanaerobaculia bacterium]
VNVLTWEISLPDRLLVKEFGGNALSADLVPESIANNFTLDGESADQASSFAAPKLRTLGPGQIGGVIVDPAGAVVPGAEVTVNNTQTGASLTTRSDDNGRWSIGGMQTGPVSVVVTSPGFKNWRSDLNLQASQPAQMATTLDVGQVSETVTITDSASPINSRQIRDLPVNGRGLSNLYSISQNVTSLQRRVAGILPVAIEVPKSGKAYRFVRPLVLEEETRVTFQYKSR